MKNLRLQKHSYDCMQQNQIIGYPFCTFQDMTNRTRPVLEYSSCFFFIQGRSSIEEGKKKKKSEKLDFGITITILSQEVQTISIHTAVYFSSLLLIYDMLQDTVSKALLKSR